LLACLLGLGDVGHDLRVLWPVINPIASAFSACFLERFRGCATEAASRLCNLDVIQIAERSLQVFENFAEAFTLDSFFSTIKQRREKYTGIAQSLDRNAEFVPARSIELLDLL
jgi:hypothetical protein